MKRVSVYGRNLARCFGLDDAPSLVTRTPSGIELFATEICVDARDSPVRPSPCEDAVMVALMLRDHPSFIYWENDTPASPAVLRHGDTMFLDPRRSPAIEFDRPFHALFFTLPRQGRDLDCRPGTGVTDATIRSLGLVIETALAHPGRISPLCVEYTHLALASYVAQAYGGTPSVQGGLAPWQERRAKEALEAHLVGGLPLEDVARECRLSVGHFSRAFRQTTGMPPHQWLLRQRIETAKRLLATSRMSLAEVATASGFGSQSYLTRFFSRRTGVSPGVWRRYQMQ